ncbi:phosphatidylserine decarboxylase proenzyme, mitochondrial isoform X1 [Hylaeus anthracinus]|uniref:phosphatidylserine decarboxylase proenzyme, mitochondrial isoform X1 n=2 Tax=Hylaeus anthracinus TaxID=313031 RepID=UPI0023BA091D|nr:phosphatidylserine decarboxylase proenzyme, mitochondrial isoform X1 [Hylaeus anthracinus]
MTVYKISRFIQHVRRNSYECCTDMYTKGFLKISIKQKFSRRHASNTSTTQHKVNPWYSFVKWEWGIPTGVGISLLAILQWKHLKKYPYAKEDSNVYEPINVFVVNCYYYLPLRIISRIWGWIASLKLPVVLRPTLYGFYAKTFDANLDEVDLDLSDFPSLVDFFVRPLKPNARPIDHNTNMVSPSDGTVLHFGPVTSCHVEQVKGITYNLRHFLGDIRLPVSDQPQKFTKEDDNAYVKSLLKNPVNQLYQLVVYLAPGDYHRFHSPTDWEIEFRRHFQGKLLSVNPKIAQYLPDLFSLNERVVYIGKWTGGFMAYTAVGATNVGSIKVYCDKDLHTNTIKWPEVKHWKDATLDCARISKGELFGEFRMGSTVVLLFEGPKDFKFCIKAGQTIKVGQALTECAVRTEEKQHKHSL